MFEAQPIDVLPATQVKNAAALLRVTGDEACRSTGRAVLTALVFLGHAQSWRPMIEAARLSQRHLANVPTNFTHRVNSAVAKGMNSKIATMHKRACGLRNRDRFKVAADFRCGGLQLATQRLTSHEMELPPSCGQFRV